MSLGGNIEQDLRRFRARVLAATVFVFFAFSLLGFRLIYLQIWRYQDLFEQAENNRKVVAPVVPTRGVIMDRNGVIVASNYSAYTLEITPSKTRASLEELIEELSKVVPIYARDKRRFKKLLDESKSFESVPIRTRLTDEEVARFAAQRFRYPGVEIKARLFRSYPFGALASHLIGYIGRINEAEKLGFKHCILPKNNFKNLNYKKGGIELIPVSTLKEALDISLSLPAGRKER